jgi:hypothetical protein
MLRIHPVSPANAASIFRGLTHNDHMTAAEWQSYCRSKGLLVFVAERDEDLVGYTAAESCPRRVHIRDLVGDTRTGRLLLDRLVMVAGERDLSGWVPADRPDLRRLFRRRGFVSVGRGYPQGRPAYFLFWDRNQGV